MQEASPNGGPLLSRLRGVKHGPDLNVSKSEPGFSESRERGSNRDCRTAGTESATSLSQGSCMVLRPSSGIAHLLPDITQRAVYCFCLWCGLVWMERQSQDLSLDLGCNVILVWQVRVGRARRDFSAGDMTAYLLLIQQVCQQKPKSGKKAGRMSGMSPRF